MQRNAPSYTALLSVTLQAQLRAVFLRSLTDPLIWDNETIFMDVSVRGTYPGNAFDVTPYVQLSEDEDNFTSADIYEYRRSIKVTLKGAPAYLCGCMTTCLEGSRRRACYSWLVVCM